MPVKTIENPFFDIFNRKREIYDETIKQIKSQLQLLTLNYNTIENTPTSLHVTISCRNYPKTPLLQDKKFRVMHMTEKGSEETVIARLVAVFKNNIFSITGFYVFPSLNYSTKALKEENDFFRGIGKKLLKYGLNEWVRSNREEINETTKITLEASGGSCDKCNELNDTMLLLNHIPELELQLNTFLSQFEDVREDNLIESMNLEEKINAICAFHNNMKLVNYYEKMGLIISEEPALFFVSMEGNFNEFLINCEHAGGKTKKRKLTKRKRRRYF